MEQEDKDRVGSDDFNLWAVVLTAAGKFIGKPTEQSAKSPMPDEWMTFSVIYELNSQLIPQPIRGPAGETQIALHRELSALPFFCTLEDENPISLKPVGVQWMKDLHRKDRVRYKRLVADAKDLCLQARAKESNIMLTKPGSGMPPAVPSA